MSLWKSMLLLGLVGLLYGILFFNRGIELTDEGWEIYKSYRILQGQVPYRDFFVHYTPAAFFVHALTFSLFGPYLLVGRVEMLLVGCVLPVAVYLAARQLMAQRWALVSGLITVFWGVAHWPTPIASWYALLFSVLSVACVSTFLSGRRRRWLVGAGFLAGLSLLFKQNFGLLTILPSALSLVFHFLISDRNQMAQPETRRQNQLRSLLLYGGGACLPILVLVAYLFLNSALRAFWIQAVLFLFQYRQLYHDVPFPSLIEAWLSLLEDSNAFSVHSWDKVLNTTLLYLPPLVCVGGWILIARRWWTNRIAGKYSVFLLYTLYCSFLFLEIYPKTDFIHLVWTLPPTIVLGVYLTSEAWHGLRAKKTRVVRTQPVIQLGAFAVWALPLLFACCGAGLGLRFLLAADFTVDHDTPMDLERARGILVQDELAYSLEELVDYIDSTTTPDASIFVVTNEAMIYFLADRANPTSCDRLLQPGFEAQQRLVSELEGGNVAMMIVGQDEYWTPMYRQWNPMLFDFLDSRFHLDCQIGRWAVYRPN